MSIQSLYGEKCNIYSNEVTSFDNIGGQIRTSVIKFADQKCYYTQLSGRERSYLGKNNVVADYRLFCDFINIESTDIIFIRNRWHNIVNIDNCLNHHLEILLLVIEAPQTSQLRSV